MLQALNQRRKALVAGLGGVLVYLQAIQASNPNHWVSVAILVLMFLGVHQVPNAE